LIELFWALGTLAEAALAWIALPYLGWKWFLAISGIYNVVFVIPTALPFFGLLLLFPLVPGTVG